MSFIIIVASCLVIAYSLFLAPSEAQKPLFGLNLIAAFFSALILSVLSLLLAQGNLIAANQLSMAIQADLFLAAQFAYFFAFNFLGLGIYRYLNTRFADNTWQKYSLAASNVLIGLSIAFIFFYYKRAFTVTGFISLIVILLYIEYRSTLHYMFHAYRAFVVLLLPLLVGNWILANQSLFVSVNEGAGTGIYLLKTPVELLALFFCGFLIAINFVERIKKRNVKR
jgi:hypothetical protein